MSVFISYSRVDSDFVDLLHRLLVSKGYDAWVDRRNIEVGSRWDDSIEHAIQERTHLVIVLSEESVNSQNVADEWSFALEEGKTVIPVYYSSCSIPMRLRRLQWIDFEKQPFAKAFQSLVETLGEPDNRPSDSIQLAKREGVILVREMISGVRVAFVYSDYARLGAFLNTVWFTLLWPVIKRGTTTGRCYDYGLQWILRNRVTGELYNLPDQRGVLLHEIGIEPGMELEIDLLKGDKP